MTDIVKTWLQLKTDRRAVTALEYGLIAALVAVALVTAVGGLGSSLKNTFSSVSSQLTAAQ